MTQDSVLSGIMENLDVNFDVSEGAYLEWKKHYESLKDYEKIESILGVLAKYLLENNRTNAHVLAIAIICNNRWASEQSAGNF